jgi:hypothetical protein
MFLHLSFNHFKFQDNISLADSTENKQPGELNALKAAPKLYSEQLPQESSPISKYRIARRRQITFHMSVAGALCIIIEITTNPSVK